jgi:phosphoribosylamine---glycine ligase
VVVEPFLVGEEVSFIALVDGERLLPFATSKDYKRLGDGDSGPNTGGMGAHSPSHTLSSEQCADIMERVMRPAVAGLAAEGRPLIGVLYAGLMMTADGPQVLEFNARFGDPEAQALLLRVEDDLLPCSPRGARGAFDSRRLRFRKSAGACIVLASKGYPGSRSKGEPIQGSSGGGGARRRGLPRRHRPEGRAAGGRPAAGSSTSAPPARTWPRRCAAPTPRRRRSTGRPRCCGRTSAGGCSRR